MDGKYWACVGGANWWQFCRFVCNCRSLCVCFLPSFDLYCTLDFPFPLGDFRIVSALFCYFVVGKKKRCNLRLGRPLGCMCPMFFCDAPHPPVFFGTHLFYVNSARLGNHWFAPEIFLGPCPLLFPISVRRGWGRGYFWGMNVALPLFVVPPWHAPRLVDFLPPLQPCLLG